jgi:hypothetical protein
MITIGRLNEEPFAVDASLDDRIEVIKDRIKQKTNIPISQQRLIWAGKYHAY